MNNRRRWTVLAAVPLLALAATMVSAQTAPGSAAPASPIAAGVGRAPTAWFGRRPFMQSPRLSPDARHIVVRMSNQGRDYLGLIDINQPNARPDLFIAVNEFRDAGDRTVGDFRWVGNENIVIELGSREFIFGQRVDLTRLVAYNIRTKQLTQLAWDNAGPQASSILHVDHDRGHLLLERQTVRDRSFNFHPEVIDVDVATGRTTTVQPSNVIVDGWFADANGVIRFGVGSNRDNGRTRIMYRPVGGDLHTISNSADASFTGAGIEPLFIDPNSDMAIVADNKSGFRKLYRVNLSTMAYSEPIFEVAGYDVDSFVQTSFDRQRAIGFAATRDRSTMNWTDPVFREVQQVLDETFGAGNSRIVSRDRTDRIYIIRAARTNQPGAFYLFNSTTGNMRQVGFASAQIRDAAMNPVSTFRYRASDGMEIEAILTMPRHRQQTRGLPVVVLTHGGPFGVRDEASYDIWAQAIAELGYVVVQPNYRGSGGYGRAFVTAGRNDGFGLRMQDDLNDVVDHLAAQGTVDPRRACMMGWSYGGYASARAAQRDPARWRCTIAGAGVYDLAMMRSYDVDYLGSFGSNYLAKGAADLASVSPAANAGGRWAPILIVHGVRDQRVPVAQARTLVSRLRGAGKVQGTDFDYIEQPQNTHNLPYEAEMTQWLEGAERWLTRWNPAYAEGDSDRPVPVVAGTGVSAARP